MEQTISAVSLTHQLVQIDSTNPGNGESEMERFLLAFAGNLNYSPLVVRTDEVSAGRRNIMLALPGKGDEPELVFICHMDTVPVGGGWDTDPFSGEITKGRIYGRGSCDMKSGFACALSAFCSAAESGRNGEPPRRTIKLIGTVDEEGDMTGVEKAIRSGWVTKDSLVLDTEPTGGEIQMAHKGRVWFEITAEGITAHASTPWKGADAIAAMAEVISCIRKEFQQLTPHSQLGVPTVSFGRIDGGTQPYVVSDSCSVTVDMRLVPPYTSEYAEEMVKNALRHAEQEVPKTKISYRVTGNRPFIETNENSCLLGQLRDVCEKITGQAVNVSVFNGYTDTAVIAGKLGNGNCMSYGPGNLELAHKPNEYVQITDIIRCEQVLKELVRQLW